MPSSADLTVFEFRSLDEYREHWRRMASRFAERVTQADALCAGARPGRRPFRIEAISYPAGQSVDLEVEWSSAESQPVWREYLICPLTRLNARMRACVHLIDSHLGLYPDDPVYLTEQTTPLYQNLRGRFQKLVGTEYLDPNAPRGWVDARGVRHEDLTRTSFPAASFAGVLSFECLEHIPDYRAALAECRRLLQPGGRLFLSTPFAASQAEHVIRARLKSDGSVEHLMEPEYHGDPAHEAGCLCFAHFGWNLLADLKAAGFVDPRVLAVWSRTFGYLGDEMLFVLAQAA